MRNVVFLVNLICFTLAAQSQTLRRPVAAPYAGFGAYSIQHADVFSFTSNPASLAQLKNAAAGVYAERRFLLSELSNYEAVTGITTTSGNFGLNMAYSGFSDYNETKLGLVYGRKLGTRLDIGAQFNYNSIRIAGYGNAAAVSFEIGSVLHFTEKLHAGIHINNPVGGKFGKEQAEKLPSLYTLGLGYEASDNFFVSTEIIKEEDQPVNVNAGFQYRIIPQLLARAGVSSATTSGWAGVGLSWKSYRLDITSGYHPQLGFTPGLLLLINFKEKEK
ncbi:MAG: hypothetical protein J0L56_11870 [Chitinophagales bacterium]|nr:hypothetical protein [Chitinophagales bacterium]